MMSGMGKEEMDWTPTTDGPTNTVQRLHSSIVGSKISYSVFSLKSPPRTFRNGPEGETGISETSEKPE